MKIALKPNCLLTRRPLKLVSGPKSIFFYRYPWAELPEVLYEHGYMVEVFNLPFNNKELRRKSFTLQLSQLNNSHIIIDDITYIEFSDVLKQVENSTVTIIGKTFNPAYKTFSLGYSLHTLWLKFFGLAVTQPENVFLNAPQTTLYSFIDHCIHLAELDFLS